MHLKLHHFFILVAPGGAPGDKLRAIGLKEADSRVHPGQGTENRRFYFIDGMMLELLWVRDAEEASTGPARELYFSGRAMSDQASPFGLIFCPAENTTQAPQVMPFPGWSYQPDYFEPPMAFHVGENSCSLNEPLVIYSPFFNTAASKINSEDITSSIRIRLTVPLKNLSPVLKIINHTPGLTIETGAEHLIEVFFDNGHECKIGEVVRKDLRPSLPLIIYSWKKTVIR
ncbi:MAG: hypothetical protein OEM38_01430 [Gammaproteobacteria bacterium]|nr:hypothetical protein [Gammaproteobacteria bacterium]